MCELFRKCKITIFLGLFSVSSPSDCLTCTGLWSVNFEYHRLIFSFAVSAGIYLPIVDQLMIFLKKQCHQYYFSKHREHLKLFSQLHMVNELIIILTHGYCHSDY